MTLAIFDPEAKSEFLAAIRYYEDCQCGLGRRFRVTVEAAVRTICNTPLLYRMLKAPFRRCLLATFPYAVIYSIEPDHIRIIAVAHNKRKPEYWANRAFDM